MKTFLLFFISISFIAAECRSQTNSQSYSREAQIIGGYDSLYLSIEEQKISIEPCNKKGKVFIKYDISEKGEPRNAKIAKSLCPEADSTAVEIVRSLKFRPAIKNGEVIKSTRLIFIPFGTLE